MTDPATRPGLQLQRATVAELRAEIFRRHKAARAGSCPWCGRWQGTDPATCGQPEQHRFAQLGWHGRWRAEWGSDTVALYYSPPIETCRTWTLVLERRSGAVRLVRDGYTVERGRFDVEVSHDRAIAAAIEWAESLPSWGEGTRG